MVDKTCDKNVNKAYAEYEHGKLNEKGEKLGKP